MLLLKQYLLQSNSKHAKFLDAIHFHRFASTITHFYLLATVQKGPYVIQRALQK